VPRFKPIPQYPITLRNFHWAPHLNAHREAFMAQTQVETTHAEGHWTLQVNARCLLWRGFTRVDGRGFFSFDGKQMAVQDFAYAVFVGRIETFDRAGQPAKMVARCGAANTPNCVARDHLITVKANSRFWHETTIEVRQEIRRRQHLGLYETDLAKEMARHFRLTEPRIYRILTYLEGASDERLVFQLNTEST